MTSSKRSSLSWALSRGSFGSSCKDETREAARLIAVAYHRSRRSQGPKIVHPARRQGHAFGVQ